MEKNKTTPIIIGISIIVIVALFVLVQKNSKKETPNINRMPPVSTEGQTMPVQESANQNTPDTSTTTNVSSSSTQTTKPTTTTTKTTVKEYTLAEVALHNQKSDCWTAINGGVYNVTSWIPNHPGGESAIMSLCGVDGSAAFNGKHGGQPRPASELASFKIGVLKK